MYRINQQRKTAMEIAASTRPVVSQFPHYPPSTLHAALFPVSSFRLTILFRTNFVPCT